MKVLSMYLPQFHTIPENDAWWGKGFTDWFSTKKGTALFAGHYQPHVPLNGNYYNLLEKDIMQWQATLMKKYGIDGQCIYHYWFKDGKKVLEKPAENLLKWTDVEMPFCFCWANETWARSWSGLRNFNTWSDNDEPEKKKGEKAILLEQHYGQDADWKKHFDYLLPFFLDERYITCEGMPVFLIYRSSEVYCLDEMMECFNKWAVNAGLKGIYFICANSGDNISSNVNAILIHEPQNSMRQLNVEVVENDVHKLDYEHCWEVLMQSRSKSVKTYFEGFVCYDDTPRRGINGTVIINSLPELFEANMTKLLAKSELAGNEFVFVNAWNEWGEGMHLEPDEKWGYRYLEGIMNAKENYLKFDLQMEGNFLKSNPNETAVLRQKEKFELYLNILDDWMTNREYGISLIDYFEAHNYRRIAIYGYNLFSRHLLYELKNSSIQVVVMIDKQRDKILTDIPVVLPEEELPEIDVIVVSAFYYINDIRPIYADRRIKVISMESIIKETGSR